MKNFKDFFKPKGAALKYSESEAREITKKYEINFFPEINFEFIKSHRGFKKGKKHLLLGTTGKGKSTVTRSIIRRAIAGGKKVLLYSTEEKREDYIYFFSKQEISENEMGNLLILHEEDCHQDPLDAISRMCIEESCDLIVFDNITTSMHYTGKLEDAKNFTMKLSETIDALDRPLFLIAHTDAKTRDDQQVLITANDVRGFKLLPNMCEVIYAFYSIRSVVDVNGEEQDRVDNFINLVKSRFISDSKFFRLTYDPKQIAYSDDYIVTEKNFTRFKKIAAMSMKDKEEKKDEQLPTVGV